MTTGLGALAVLVDDGQIRAVPRFPRRAGAPLVSSCSGISLAAVIIAVVHLDLIVLDRQRPIPRDRPRRLAAGARDRRAVSGIIRPLRASRFTVPLGARRLVRAHQRRLRRTSRPIVGTVLGFIAAAYIPIGVAVRSGGRIRSIAALPFAQAGMLLRREFSDDTLASMTGRRTGRAAEPSASSRTGIDLAIGGCARAGVVRVRSSSSCITVGSAPLLSAGRIRRRIR